jgi:hypothetical protein
MMLTLAHHYYCSLNKENKIKKKVKFAHIQKYNSQVAVHFYFVHFLMSHIILFFLYILLYNQYRKKNLISRSITSSVSDNDREKGIAYFSLSSFLLLLNFNSYAYLSSREQRAHTHTYVYKSSTILHREREREREKKHHHKKKERECGRNKFMTFENIC